MTNKPLILLLLVGICAVVFVGWLWWPEASDRDRQAVHSAIPNGPADPSTADTRPGSAGETAASGSPAITFALETERRDGGSAAPSSPAAGAASRSEGTEGGEGGTGAHPGNGGKGKARHPEGPMGEAADLLSRRVDLSDPEKRAELVAKLREIEEKERSATEEKAARLGLPMELVEPDGTKLILVGFDGDLPLYEGSENVNAAISTAANQVRATAPYHVNGNGLVFGLWESGGIPRLSHREFGNPSKVTVRDGSATATDHATHVAGTLAGLGISATALGMAPAASIDAYDSTNALSEMAAVGASYPGEPGKIYISNHSYGLILGWRPETSTWYGTFTDNGNSSDDIDTRFGRYDSTSVSYDGMLYNLPYFLPFWSAGNDRNNNPPSAGQPWFQGPGGTQRPYDPAQHPVGDGVYKNGYDLLSGPYKSSKNLMTVGAVNDAVAAGMRNPANGTLTSFSSTGATDDGRIKPDIVANGASLSSPVSSSDSAYSSYSGTSMASPNAAGSAMLLVDYYRQRFPGQAMRASTLKGLIIHTADDIGRPGPDYQYGWGLMNTRAAAELIGEQADFPASEILIEDIVIDGGSKTYTFSWDGSSPIRATLCWTDPPGSAFATHDNRTPDLRNDLNLKIAGPDAGIHLPFVMPYVGNWSNAMLTAPATRGINHVDNVEQALVESPLPGLYTVTVDHAGSLADGEQHFSLIVTGASTDAMTVSPSDALTSSGPVGGPFVSSAKTYHVSNTGGAAFGWVATADRPWLSISPSSGTLGPGQSVPVEVSLNAAAGNLDGGLHIATVEFANTGSGALRTRQATLVVATDHLTEWFTPPGNPHDLDHLSFLFTPDGSSAGYSVVREAAAVFPTDPAGGVPLALGDDASATVNLAGGAQVSLFGSNHSQFHVGPNGYITFGSGDSEWVESLARHFDRPRISALFNDFNPAGGGQVSWKQMPDRVAVTWDSVPQHGLSDANSFQVEMFFDGRLRITHLGIAATDGLIGLSRGTGIPAGFQPSDFSSYPYGSDVLMFTSHPISQAVLTGAPATFAATAVGPQEIAYEWYKDGGGVPVGTGPVLTIPSAQFSHQGSYHAVATMGEESIASEPATLSVFDPVTITSHPQGLTVNRGVQASFSATASGTGPLRYQWRRNGIPVGDDEDVSGTQSPVLTVRRATVAWAGTYSVTVSNDASSETSEGAVLAVVHGELGGIVAYDLSTDPGWDRDGEWQFGTPQGAGGETRGQPDPSSGFTGANVFGVNLNGDYSTAPGGPFHLTAGPVDLSEAGSVALRFKRWLNTGAQPGAEAAVEVSNDGIVWHPVWSNGPLAVEDGSWKTETHDVSAVAANQDAVWFRWSYSVGPGASPYAGWNIDDVEILSFAETDPPDYLTEVFSSNRPNDTAGATYVFHPVEAAASAPDQTEAVAEAERGVPPPPMPAPGNVRPATAKETAVADVFAAEELVAVRETPVPDDPSTLVVDRLVRTRGKHPMVRVEEIYEADGGGRRLVKRTALVADHMLVKPRPGVSEAALLAELNLPGAQVRKKMPASGIWLVSFPAALDALPEAIEAASKADRTLFYAEPDPLVSARLLPGDPDFGVLWGMHNTGQGGGVADVDIDAPEAWDLGTGSRDVLVGIIDTGVDYGHPDLASNIWTNPGEIPGNGIDDDGNGYIDDVRGWNFVSDTNDPMDDEGHGTHVAGTIGAAGNDGTGVAGVCWQVSLLPLKFLDDQGDGFTSDAVEAVAYATSLGVDLTNNSWGGYTYSQALRDVIGQAGAAGVLFVAAAGNEINDNDLWPAYPASYPLANVISVASITDAGQVSWFSNYGASSVHLAAPGSAIFSSIPGGGYAFSDGTSMAAPHVAGVCALLKAYRPSLTHSQIRAAVLGSVEPLATLEGRTLTGGLLNAARALESEFAVTPGSLSAKGSSGGPFAPSSKTYELNNLSPSPTDYTVSADRPWVELSSTQGSLDGGGTASVIVSLGAEAASLPNGFHTAEVMFTGLASGQTVIREVSVTVFAGYHLTRNPVATFPTDPAGGTSLSLGDDDFAEIPLTGGAEVSLFGRRYSSVFVNSNGSVTFGQGDGMPNYSSPGLHFSLPRVSGVFTDLDPATGGTISSKQLADHLAITFQNVREYGSTRTNRFQFQLYFDGRVAVTVLDAQTPGGVIGISDGSGLPEEFQSSDFSTYPAIQTIHFPPIPDQLAPNTVNLSATGGGSGQPVVFAVAEGPATIDGSVLRFTGAGQVGITASQAGDANHLPALDVTRTFHVTKAPQTILFPAIPTTPANTPVDLSATGGTSGNPIVYTVVDGPATVVDGTRLTFHGTGSVSVRASQAGNALYEDAPPVVRTFNVIQAVQQIVFPPISQKLTTDTVLLSAAGGDSGNPLVFTVVDGPGVISNGNLLSFIGAGTVRVAANQAGNEEYSAAPQVIRSITVVKAQAEIHLSDLLQTYDGTARTVSVSTHPPGATVRITYNGLSEPGVDAGSYLVVATFDDPIYQGTEVTATLEVGRQPIQIVLSGLLQLYTGAPRAVRAETRPAGLGVRVTYDGSETPPAAAGSYMVRAEIDDPNRFGAVEARFVINTLPTLRFTGKKSIRTSRSTYPVKGKASDADADLAHVMFIDARQRGKRWRKARGTVSWTATAVLRNGRNVIQARAYDKNGAASRIERIKILRR